MWEESQLVVERINGMLATEGSILQAAASTAVAAFGKDGGKKASKEFIKLMERLSGTSTEPQKKNLTEQLLKEKERKRNVG